MRLRGLTTRSLGSAVGVSSAAVTGWCKGARPRPEMCVKLAKVFDVSVEQLTNDALSLGTEKPEPYRVIEEAPAAVQEAFFTPGLAWPHYLEAESLLDYLLAERAGKPLTEEDRKNFGETLRHFMAHRERGRKSLHEATQLAEDIGTHVLGKWMGARTADPDRVTPAVAAKVAKSRRLYAQQQRRKAAEDPPGAIAREG